jgi:ubiquitin C-terminal hydrolase
MHQCVCEQMRFPEKFAARRIYQPKSVGVPQSYHLRAVLVHKGRSKDYGHYYAFVKRGETWYKANDDQMSEVRTCPNSTICQLIMFPDCTAIIWVL